MVSSPWFSFYSWAALHFSTSTSTGHKLIARGSHLRKNLLSCHHPRVLPSIEGLDPPNRGQRLQAQPTAPRIPSNRCGHTTTPCLPATAGCSSWSTHQGSLLRFGP